MLASQRGDSGEALDPYSHLESNYDIFKLLHDQLTQPKFKFFQTTEEGDLLTQILNKTNALKEQFIEMKAQKRSEHFDPNKYFKLLDNVQNSGLPEEASVIEEARIELKREKWIKKFNDLQQTGKQNQQLSAEDQEQIDAPNQSP